MILHMDMDAFFAQVEQLDHPAYAGKPVIIGGTSNRGVVATASYEARKFGVHSAMPIFQAKQKCPQGIFVPPRRQRYAAISHAIMALVRQYSPLVEQVSIDEAYIDVTGCERLHGFPREIAAKIKSDMRKSLHLTCSIGIAPVKFLAKIASEINKPDGLTLIAAKEVAAFIDGLRIESVPGIGKTTLPHLRKMGIRTLGDVRAFPEAFLIQQFGKMGKRLKQISLGVDASPVCPSAAIKSVSSEETLPKDTDDINILKAILLKHAESVGQDLRKKGLKAKTVTLKLKDQAFKQYTRNRKLPQPTNVSQKIYCQAILLLDAFPLQNKLRLIGVGASGVIPEDMPQQLALFEPLEEVAHNWERVETAMDAIAEKFGRGKVKKAVLAEDQPSMVRKAHH